ncbi:bifunctional 2-C-methyl-D-erythritol 4-phosphate cytidylyltransferase/2-C-methyl-D-erythritol 2,4-cyclodiphosphate synthase [Rhodobacterales bacterium 52_120_T64]|nr:bifunctional 2-C-methyl-D-erythritol 4-phosphate cytidylyltransferase/2-C-methyl-D-erythritol 2,4-cyclodiphosphate synthase [Rhodobacterales bacterium 52_120_T64]
MKVTGLIVAAGRGTRAGGGIPKQYRDLDGQTVLRRSVLALLAHSDVDAVQVVIHSDDINEYEAAVNGISNLLPVCLGGTERHDSVLAGLNALKTSAPEMVLIHDAARPLVPVNVIAGVISALKSHTAAFPALSVVDALWRGNDTIEAPETRENLWRAQTPQGFRFAEILAAHENLTIPALDDVAVAHAAGLSVAITQGAEDNFKITNPEDFARAERILKDNMDIRTGNGFDVHKFGEGNHVTLCGVDIPHTHGLVGHSDADVAMHTVTDAIFGALCEGDIGQWFPPSDMQWKGAASDIFLAKSVERAAVRGFTITHIDCTIICEMPKIGPHALVMRERMAQIIGIDLDRVSVKATTSEKLGFTGRGEGIAATATATLVKT